MFSMLLIALAADLSVAPAAVEIDPRKMSQSEIRAHNAGLARKDPNFIRCVSSEDTGSLVRRRVSCRTNAAWALADEIGNQDARDTYQAMQGKAANPSP